MRIASFSLLLLAGAASGQTEIAINCPAGQMRYDRKVISARPGEKLKIKFSNEDAMPHNIVFCRPKDDGTNDKGLEVAMKAWELAAAGEGKAWIPEHARIIAHSKMVPAHGSSTMEVQAPDIPGVYPFVCTFPGHAMIMNGELRVQSTGPGLTDARFKLYLGSWDRIPDFTKLTPHREGSLPDNLLQVNLEGVANDFAFDYTGKLTAPADGSYLFFMDSDDGSRLYIDGKQVMEHDGIHSSGRVRTARVPLKAGSHDFRVTYFENAGEEQLYVAWAGQGFSETPLSKWIHPSRINGGQRDDERGEGIVLAPENSEPVIYRNFIEDVSPRGICVGYPNGMDLCFDADQMTLALVWRGAFIDARRHWTDRGAGRVSPLGFDSIRLSIEKTPGLALLDSAAAPWPRHLERAAGIQFLGYHLDKKRQPSFRYRMGNVTVEDGFEPSGEYTSGTETLTRTVNFTAEGEAPSNLNLRLAYGGGLKAKDSAWTVDDRLLLTVEAGAAQLREQPSRDLLAPVKFENGKASLRVRYSWLP